jgi:hypothetical protein
MKNPFSRSSFCDFDVSQLANTSCNKAQSAVRQCLSALSQHSVSTLSALCQHSVRTTLSAFKVVGRAQTFWGFGVWYHNLIEESFPTRIPSIKLRATTKEVTAGCQPLLIAYVPCDMHDIVQTYLVPQIIWVHRLWADRVVLLVLLAKNVLLTPGDGRNPSHDVNRKFSNVRLGRHTHTLVCNSHEGANVQQLRHPKTRIFRPRDKIIIWN